MNYVTPETTEIHAGRNLAGSDSALVGANWLPSDVRVRNARVEEDLQGFKMTLDGNGFELRNESAIGSASGPSSMPQILRGIDFCHQDDVVDLYYPLCETLVETCLAASSATAAGRSHPRIACVRAFDHNVRSSEKASLGTLRSKGSHASASASASATTAASTNAEIQNPAGLVHADYTRDSAPRRLLDLSRPPKANDVLRSKLTNLSQSSLLDPTMVHEALDGRRRYAFVNVWRNIDRHHPVESLPLACVDASSSSVHNLRTFFIHYPDRVGENYFVCPENNQEGEEKEERQRQPSESRQHQWYYYRGMVTEEALLIKQWDSCGSIALGRNRDDARTKNARPSTFAIHSAFVDPSSPVDAKPRSSIEVRCIVVWESEE